MDCESPDGLQESRQGSGKIRNWLKGKGIAGSRQLKDYPLDNSRYNEYYPLVSQGDIP